MERDIQLDCYRALAMIYIVCVIHIIYWFYIGSELIKSMALFEMPVIFFIAGASQSYKKRHDLKSTIISRIKRVLLPYYVFVVFLFIWYYSCTKLNTTFYNQHINIQQLNTLDIIKILATGGNDNIPYLGYTWFISCYMIVSCSLPIQKKILERTSPAVYVAGILATFVLWKLTGMSSPENIVENLLTYNFFYITGYSYYRRIEKKYISILAIIPVTISAYLLLSGTAVPMQFHKFPPDTIFLVYCFGILCILGIIFSKVNIKYNYILKIWNERGYTIYLYQSISHFILYKATAGWIDRIHNDFATFIICFILIFIITTALSYITFPIEKLLLKYVTNLRN